MISNHLTPKQMKAYTSINGVIVPFEDAKAYDHS